MQMLHLGSVLIAYNATRSLIMGYSPYFLMFGCRPRLPIDLLFPTAMWQGSTRTINDYILSLYERLKEALSVARDSTIMEAQQQKRHYDWKARAVELQPGDKVLVKLDAFHGQRQKLKNRWSGDLLQWLNVWRMGYQLMWSRMTRQARNKCFTVHDCYSGLPSMMASLSE